MTERNGSRSSNSNTTDENFGIGASKLALEEAVKLGIPWRSLAVRYALRCWCVPRLLDKDLRELDNVGVVSESLGQIDHVVCLVLLIAWTSSSKKSAERSNGLRITLLTTTGSKTSCLPLGG